MYLLQQGRHVMHSHLVKVCKAFKAVFLNYIQCVFSLNGNVATDPDLKASINSKALSTVELVTYLRVNYST